MTPATAYWVSRTRRIPCARVQNRAANNSGAPFLIPPSRLSLRNCFYLLPAGAFVFVRSRGVHRVILVLPGLHHHVPDHLVHVFDDLPHLRGRRGDDLDVVLDLRV